MPHQRTLSQSLRACSGLCPQRQPGMLLQLAPSSCLSSRARLPRACTRALAHSSISRPTLSAAAESFRWSACANLSRVACKAATSSGQNLRASSKEMVTDSPPLLTVRLDSLRLISDSTSLGCPMKASRSVGLIRYSRPTFALLNLPERSQSRTVLVLTASRSAASSGVSRPSLSCCLLNRIRPSCGEPSQRTTGRLCW
jgi:hypothetical protein